MNRLVFLSGDDRAMDLISGSIPAEIFIPSSGDGYACFFSFESEEINEELVLSSIEDKIALIGGISRLVLNIDPEIRIKNIVPAEGEKDEYSSNSPKENSEGVIISCDEDGDEEIEIKSPFESVFLVASADPGIKSALKEMGCDFESWGGFMKIYRIIEMHAGDPASKGWCSPDERDWFVSSAEGFASAPGDTNEDPCNPMYFSEAESFVTILMQEWIKEKKRELDL